MLSAAAPRPGPAGGWALPDLALLLLALAASSDMLVQLGRWQPAAWIACYALLLARLGADLPLALGLWRRHWPVAAYPLVCLASVAWSQDRGGSLVAALQLSMTFAIAALLGWRYSLGLILRALALVLGAALLLSLLHGATGLMPWPAQARSGGLAGLFSHKNMLGQRAMICALALLALLLAGRRHLSGPGRALALWMLPVALLALWLSRSATALLLTPPLMLALLLLCARRLPGPVAVALWGALAFAVALGPLALALGGIAPIPALLDLAGKDATLTGRTALWALAAGVIADHPLLGVGYGAVWTAPDFATARLLAREAGALTGASFHNFVLEILVSTGGAGLLAMLALIGRAARRLWRLHRRGAVAATGGLVLIGAIIACSLVGASLFRRHEFMLLLLVLLAVSAREETPP